MLRGRPGRTVALHTLIAAVFMPCGTRAQAINGVFVQGIYPGGPVVATSGPSIPIQPATAPIGTLSFGNGTGQVLQVGATVPAASFPSPLQSGGSVTISGKDDLDLARNVLMLGFRNDGGKVQGLEGAIRRRLNALIATAGSILKDEDFQAILLNVAKDYLSANGFGFLVTDALDPILKNVIARIVASRNSQGDVPAPPAVEPAKPTTPTTPDVTPSIDVPGDGIKFQVSGVITLKPVGAGPIREGGETTGTQTSAGTVPPDVPSDGQPAPVPTSSAGVVEPGVQVAPSIP